nr:hypothetical protein [Tanacetum cinerariifolium]
FVFEVKVVSMIPVLAVDQMSVPMSVVSVQAPMETMLYLFHRGLAASYLLRRLAAPYILRRLAAPYLLRRRYSLVIAYGPEVAFVTPAIPMDRSNMEWFCLRNIRS